MDYYTLKTAADAETVVNKSRFISHAAPAESAEAANAFVQEMRRRYPDTTHNVFAFQIRQPEYSRYSDDGEPPGTSGMPVLQVLKGRELTNSIIVVTRYFGGVLLGTGGLVRAYTQAAVLGVEAAGIVCMRRCVAMACPCPYPFYERMTRLLEKHGCVTEDTSFEASVVLRFRIPCENEAAFLKELTELSNGTVSVQKNGEKFDQFDV